MVMIKFSADQTKGNPLSPLSYATPRMGFGRLILTFTRWRRAVHAGRFIGRGQQHLDIGCGDGYFLERSPCQERIGLDLLLGDKLEDTAIFPDGHFDIVTMLAVIEHLPDPDTMFREAARLLRTGGKFIITTPKVSAEKFIRLYASEVDNEHLSHFDLERIKGMMGPWFELEAYRTFLLGMNQVFCLKKAPKAR